MSRKRCAKYKMPVEPVIAANDFQEYVYRSFLMPSNGPAFLEKEIKKRIKFLKTKEPHYPSPPFPSNDFPTEGQLNRVDKETLRNPVINYAKSSLRDYALPAAKQLEDTFFRRYAERKPFLLGPLAQRLASCLLNSKKETNPSFSDSCEEYSERNDNLEFLSMIPLESCGELSENDDDREFLKVNASESYSQRSENGDKPEFLKNNASEYCKELRKNDSDPEFPKMTTSESCEKLHENNGNPGCSKWNASESYGQHSENSESCVKLHENNGNPGFSKRNASESCGQHSENSDKPEFLKNNTSESCRMHSEKNNMDIPRVNPSRPHEKQMAEALENKLKAPFIRGLGLERRMKKCLNRLGMTNTPEIEAMGKLFQERRKLMRQLKRQTAENVVALQNIQEQCLAYSHNLQLIKTKHQLYEYHAKHFNKKTKKSSCKKRKSAKSKKR